MIISPGTDSTEQRLRDVLTARAALVPPSRAHYGRAHATWKHRERRRRLTLAILAAGIFAAADAVGIWALNHSTPDSHIVFSNQYKPDRATIRRIGQP